MTNLIYATAIMSTLAFDASATTVNDLTMTIIDGRPAFRPDDGLDCYTAKFGGIVTDCAEIDKQGFQLPAPPPLFRQLGMTDQELLAAVFNGYEVPLSPVPLPWSGALITVIFLMMVVWGKKAQTERMPTQW